MKHLQTLKAESLRWEQPRTLTSAYVLKADGSDAATLTFRSAWGTLAKAESADGCWTFKRVGFLATRVSIRRCDGDTDLATFAMSPWGSGSGTLELADGRRFEARAGFWQTRFELQSGSNAPLVTLEGIGGMLRLAANVTIHDAARTLPELPWLVMLAWYLTVMLHRDSSAAMA